MARDFQRVIERFLNEYGDLAAKKCRPFLAHMVSNHDSWAFRECFFGCILSLDHIRKRNADGTPDINDIPKVIDKIILEFINTVRNELNQPNNASMLLPDVEEGIDSRLPENCLHVLCRFDPTRFMDVIGRIYGFDRPSSEIYFAKLASFLYNNISAFPQSVIMWTVRYRSKLEFFIKNYREALVMSAIYHHIDLTKTMMLDEEGSVDLLTVLNDFIADRKNIAKHRNEFPIITNHVMTMSDRDLSLLAYRYAGKCNMYHVIPAAMAKRKLFDFNYQMKNAPKEDRLKTCLQFVNCSPTLEEKLENLALVRKVDVKIACAIIQALDLPGKSEAEKGFGVFSMADVNRYRNEIQKMLEEQRIDSIVLKDANATEFERKISLVDDASQLDDLIDWINHQEVVAFDVEANFVFQSTTGNQIATLLEIANRDECKVVDIFLLKKQLSDDDWRAFFDAFLRPRMCRVGHDVKNDVDFLIQAFPFLHDEMIKMKPVFSCIQKLIVYMYGDQIFKKNFKNTTSTPLALCGVVKEIFDEEMPKGLQTSNWELRPLSRDQLIYAANDAFYTFRVNEFLMDLQYQKPNDQLTKHCLYRLDNKIVNAATVKGEDVTFTELLHILEGVVADMHSEALKLTPSTDITIIVDVPFLKAVPTLRRVGFRTWDHRDNKEEPPNRNARQMSAIFVKKLTEIVKERDIESTYVLSNRKNIFDVKTMIFESRLILDNQEQNMPILLTNVLRTTNAKIDFEAALRRCAVCSSTKDILDVPMPLFRLIFKAFATIKGFADTIPEIAGDLEEDVKVANELPDWTYIGEESLIYKKDELIVKFPIDMTTKIVSVTKPGIDERMIPMKCNTKLVRQVDLPTVKFCYHCGLLY